MKPIFTIALLFALLTLPGCGNQSSPPAKAASADRCPHDIKAEKCPFCNPALVASEGLCAEHGVPEAYCCQCRPYMKAAFRAKGDWCAEHDTPESQCVVCNPQLKTPAAPGTPAPGTPGTPG